MNVLIRDFVKQSGLEIYGLGLDRAKWESCVERFTELIVKETLQVARAGMEFGNGMDEAVYTYFELKK